MKIATIFVVLSGAHQIFGGTISTMDVAWQRPVLHMMREAEAAQTKRELVDAVRLHAPETGLPTQGAVLQLALENFSHQASALNAIECVDGDDADQSFFLRVARALWDGDQDGDSSTDEKRPRPTSSLLQLLESQDVAVFVAAHNINAERAGDMVKQYATAQCVPPVLEVLKQHLSSDDMPQKKKKQKTQKQPKPPQQVQEECIALLDKLQSHSPPLAAPAPPHDDNPLVAAALAHDALLDDQHTTIEFQRTLLHGLLEDTWFASRRREYGPTKVRASKYALKQARALYCLVRDHLPALRRLRPTPALLSDLMKHVHALTAHVARAPPEQLAWWRLADPLPAVADVKWLMLQNK